MTVTPIKNGVVKQLFKTLKIATIISINIWVVIFLENSRIA